MIAYHRAFVRRDAYHADRKARICYESFSFLADVPISSMCTHLSPLVASDILPSVISRATDTRKAFPFTAQNNALVFAFNAPTRWQQEVSVTSYRILSRFEGASGSADGGFCAARAPRAMPACRAPQAPHKLISFRELPPLFPT